MSALSFACVSLQPTTLSYLSKVLDADGPARWGYFALDGIGRFGFRDPRGQYGQARQELERLDQIESV